jgi:hypothetical protein
MCACHPARVIATSGAETLGLAFGAGGLAIVVLICGLLAMLAPDDRRRLLGVLRHPVRTAFAEPDRPDEPED